MVELLVAFMQAVQRFSHLVLSYLRPVTDRASEKYPTQHFTCGMDRNSTIPS